MESYVSVVSADDTYSLTLNYSTLLNSILGSPGSHSSSEYEIRLSGYAAGYDQNNLDEYGNPAFFYETAYYDLDFTQVRTGTLNFNFNPFISGNFFETHPHGDSGNIPQNPNWSFFEFNPGFVVYATSNETGGGQQVPEPTTMLLLGLGLVGLVGVRRKFQK